MDSRESRAQAPPSQSQPQSQAPPSSAMMMGPPNSYPHSLINGTSPAMITPNSSAAAAAMLQNPSFSLNSAGQSASMAVESLNSQFGGGSMSQNGPFGFSIEPARKKRGRPRKYSPDNNIDLGLAPDSGPSLAPSSPFSPSVIATSHDNSNVGTPTSENPSKRNRGRPPSSGKKQLDALGSSGVGFTPHIILVEVGEDISAKVRAFSQEGPRTVCILSANGAICNATLLQSPISGGTVTFEGRYEIISLSGSFSPSESNGSLSQTTSLCVSLAGSDGRVLGGGVAGKLIAATPVQVIVGSFIVDGKKSKSGFSPTPSNVPDFGVPVVAGSPPSEGPSSESSHGDGDSPLNNSSAPFNNATHPVHNMAAVYSNMGWGNPTMKMF